MMTEPPIKILHVFGRLQRGGAEMRILEACRRAQHRGYRFHFAALSGLTGELDAEARGLGGAVHLLRLSLDFPLRFHRLLAEHAFDVVHSHVHHSSGLIVRLAAAAGAPVRIVHFRNVHDGNRATGTRAVRHRLLRFWIDRYATHIVAVCEGAMRAAWSSDWESDARCRVIYNGVDLSRFAGEADRAGVRREFGFAESCPLYTHVGRMVPQKNHLRIVSIFAVIAAAQPDARLLLVGRGDRKIEPRLWAAIDAGGLRDRVVLVGERTDVPRLLQAADLLLFPSLWEGLPGAVLEACSAGIPVLASELPGVAEIAAHCSGVYRLPVSATDQTWASSAREIVTGHLAGGERPDPAPFTEGVFSLSRSTEALCELWAAAGRSVSARRRSSLSPRPEVGNGRGPAAPGPVDEYPKRAW